MTETAQADGVTNAFFEPWMEFWSQAMDQGKEQATALLAAMQGTPDPEALRRRWMEALAANMDKFLRSPAFLEAMRQNFAAITELKAHGEEAAQKAAREAGVPRLADVSGLFERLHLAQQVMLERLSAIERRLDDLARRFAKSSKNH